jgi:hypothetical protein
MRYSLGSGASKLIRYPPPQNTFKKSLKPPCDEIQNFDIFPQPRHHLWMAQFGSSESPLWDVQKIGDHRFDVNYWNKFMEVSVEKNDMT